MKSRLQKQEELKNAKELFEQARVLLFSDFTKVSAEQLRRFRKELKAAGAKLLVIKKRLLSLLLKEKGIDFDLRRFKLSLAAIFSDVDLEKVSAPVFKFFSGLELPEGAAKDFWLKHILGGYDLKGGSPVDPERIIFIGKLPPREILLAQLLGTIAAPIKSLLYLLDQKSKSIAK